MPKYVPARYPKDFASTLMSVACAEAVLIHDRMQSAHAWEATEYGSKKRKGDSGTKTRGSMARNRSGQVMVSFSRMAIWENGREEVSHIKTSALWESLRKPRALTESEWAALDPVTFKASHHVFCLIGGFKRRDEDEVLLQRLACCGTFDAIAALVSLRLEALAREDVEFAFRCARYLPPAIAMLSPSSIARRVALPIFAYLRGCVLEEARWNRQVMDLTRYDIPRLQESAERLPRLCRRRSILPRATEEVSWPFDFTRTSGWDLVVPQERVDWVSSHLPPTRSVMGAGRRTVWRGALSPTSHPDGPCNPNFQPAFHADALRRIRKALGEFA